MRDYATARPCPGCPFLRDSAGLTPVRLTRDRIDEIVAGILGNPGSTFMCHATVDYGDETPTRVNERHCAGALIFAETHEHATQMTRIAERLGAYDKDALMAEPLAEHVFTSVREIRATAWERSTVWVARDGPKKKRRRRKKA